MGTTRVAKKTSTMKLAIALFVVIFCTQLSFQAPQGGRLPGRLQNRPVGFLQITVLVYLQITVLETYLLVLFHKTVQTMDVLDLADLETDRFLVGANREMWTGTFNFYK